MLADNDNYCINSLLMCFQGGACQNHWRVSDMSFINRQLGDRRWGLVTEFPLSDGADLLVLHDRRSGSERRKITASADELLKLFSELPAIDPELLKSLVK
jgi:hypothetical protein